MGLGGVTGGDHGLDKCWACSFFDGGSPNPPGRSADRQPFVVVRRLLP